MFKKNEKVVLRNTGVCEIVEIKNENFGGGAQDYYILVPVFKDKTSRVMIPCDSCQQLRKLISKEEALKIIDDIPNNQDIWIQDPRKRKEEFFNILSSGDEAKMSELLSTIYSKKIELAKNKKMLNTNDKLVFDQVEAVFYQELAIVLELEYREVMDFILNRIKQFTN